MILVAPATANVIAKMAHGIADDMLTTVVSGRIVWGIVRFVLAGLTGGSFPFSAFLSGALFTAVPGIVAQLVLIPLLLTALQKAGFAD